MDKDALWQAFAHSGLVEDYLRYRGFVPQMMDKMEAKDGTGKQAACHDRRSHSEKL